MKQTTLLLTLLLSLFGMTTKIVAQAYTTDVNMVLHLFTF